MTQEALKLALEALEKNTKHLPVHFDNHFEAITAIKEALLAQKQEPVCPDCKAKVLYECVACSSNNYPPKTEQEPVGALTLGGIIDTSDGPEYEEWDIEWNSRAIEALQERLVTGDPVTLEIYTSTQPAQQEPVAWEQFYPDIGKPQLTYPPQQGKEPVAIKRMKEWIEYLKRKSDFGQHMKIPSEMSAGTCWELAIELEQFINTTPPQSTWQGLTDEEQIQVAWSCGAMSADWLDFACAIEAKLKEKNT